MPRRLSVDRQTSEQLRANMGEIKNAFDHIIIDGSEFLTFASSCVVVAKAVVDLDTRIRALDERISALEVDAQ